METVSPINLTQVLSNFSH